jgi:hypothetical protein
MYQHVAKNYVVAGQRVLRYVHVWKGYHLEVCPKNVRRSSPCMVTVMVHGAVKKWFQTCGLARYEYDALYAQACWTAQDAMIGACDIKNRLTRSSK